MAERLPAGKKWMAYASEDHLDSGSTCCRYGFRTRSRPGWESVECKHDAHFSGAASRKSQASNTRDHRRYLIGTVSAPANTCHASRDFAVRLSTMYPYSPNTYRRHGPIRRYCSHMFSANSVYQTNSEKKIA